MKKILSLFILLTVSFFAMTQNTVAQAGKDDFAKMTFEVNLGKPTYLLLEPLQVKFKFSNQTNQPQTTLTPEFLQESKLKVTLNGQTTVFDYLSSVTGKPMRFTSIFAPGKTYEQEETMAVGLEAFFPEAGDYQIQFILSNAVGTKTLESNVINVVIEEPTGIDKQAFDFLKTHQSSSNLFGWIHDKKSGQALLEIFVEQFGASAYGELGIANLGSVYKSQGEFKKAEAQFEKLNLSKNKNVREDARSALADIERKIEAEKNKSNNR